MSAGAAALALFDRLCTGAPAAVFDAARAPGVLTDAQNDTDPPATLCLFQGETATTLADLAPYAADLSPGAPARAWVETYWGEGAFVLIDAKAEISQLRRGLRRLSLAYGPDGEALFFRFYDPRVFAATAQSFRAPHRRAFLACLTAVFVETARGEALLQLSFSETAVHRTRFEIAAHDLA
ncbi:MAG: DUF4123 domain-containing protein [Maricaulaceae bacterium]